MTIHNHELPEKEAKDLPVPDKNRIGSKNNYIVLNKKTSKRPLLQKWMPELVHTADFARHNRTEFNTDNYVLNLLSVPDLDSDSLKLGLFLFWKALNTIELNDNNEEEHVTSAIFSLLDKDVRNSRFGEDECVYIGKFGMPRSEVHPMPFRSLPEILKKNRIRMNNYDVSASLQRLDDFGFITITPIAKTHCINKDADEHETNCFHVCINFGAATARINRKWNDTPNEPKG